MDSLVPNILESVFQPRRCLKQYSPLNPSIKQYVLNLFQMVRFKFKFLIILYDLEPIYDSKRN